MRTTALGTRRAGAPLTAGLLCALATTLLAVPGGVAAPGDPRSPAASKDRPTAAVSDELQTVGIGPANADGTVDRRGVFVFAGRPGTVVKDQVALVNYTTTPRTVRVYAADAFTTDEGGFDVQPGGTQARGVAAWFDLEPKTVIIPARKSARAVLPGTRVVPFTMTIPADATSGDHAGGLVLSLESGEAIQGGNSVVVDRRVGTRVYVQVPGARESALEVVNLEATYAGTLNPIGTGSTRVTYTVRNVGNTLLSARQSTRVDTWLSDASPTTAQPDLIQLLPGAAVDVAVEVPGTWPTIRPTATVTLVPYTGTGEAAVDLGPVSAGTAFWAIPWPLIVIVLAALLLAYVLHRVNRRRRRGLSPTAEPDALEELVSI